MTNNNPLISPDLLAIMQCPVCAGTLFERPEPPALVCSDCGRAYPVRDGIPVMLVEESQQPMDSRQPTANSQQPAEEDDGP